MIVKLQLIIYKMEKNIESFFENKNFKTFSTVNFKCIKRSKTI